MTPPSSQRPFDDEQQKYYERRARLQYDPETVNQSIRRWNGYTPARQDEILAEAQAIYLDLVAALEAGASPQGEDVQAILQRWEDNLRHFYEPTLEILEGLGEAYNSDPAFITFFEKLHPNLPAYLEEAIAVYTADREHAELERLLAEDAAARLSGTE